MVDYIFESGTCLKKDFYNLLINKMKSAGWADVASKTDTDFNVMTSTGVNSDKNLVIQIRPGNATNVNPVNTTNYSQFSFRLVDGYTPGAAGVAGTFARAAAGWRELYLAPVSAAAVTVPQDTTLTYKIFANKNCVMFGIEYMPAFNLLPLFTYIGLPESVYASDSASRGLLVATTCTTPAVTASNAFITNYSDGMGSVTDGYAIPTFTQLTLKNPNNAGKYAVSELNYGSATEGTRGKIDGFYLLPNQAILTGDTISINDGVTEKKYYVYVCQTQGTSSFPTQVITVRIL